MEQRNKPRCIIYKLIFWSILIIRYLKNILTNVNTNGLMLLKAEAHVFFASDSCRHLCGWSKLYFLRYIGSVLVFGLSVTLCTSCRILSFNSPQCYALKNDKFFHCQKNLNFKWSFGDQGTDSSWILQRFDSWLELT